MPVPVLYGGLAYINVRFNYHSGSFFGPRVLAERYDIFHRHFVLLRSELILEGEM
jgi:hypothetical protein